VATIRKSIEQLGFKYADTKILLISHAHGDHDAGTGLIQKETRARLMVMDADVAEVQSTAPGHTKGCTTWTMQVEEGGRRLNAVIVGSPNVNAGYVLVGNKNYPQIAEDYVKTFAVSSRA
jgi:metallo-beta-lactamase class B